MNWQASSPRATTTRSTPPIAVEEYVRQTITYNEEIEPPPANQDVVDYVLFDSQQGYCEYYASAMAILLRLEGIPARVVGGYFPAPFDATTADSSTGRRTPISGWRPSSLATAGFHSSRRQTGSP